MSEKKLQEKEVKPTGKRPPRGRKNNPDTPLTGKMRAIPIVLSAFSIFFALSFIVEDLGVLGSFLKSASMGLFSSGAYAFPVLILIHALFFRSDISRGRLLSRVVFSLTALFAISVTVFTAQNWQTDPSFLGGEYYSLGTEGEGGGLFGSAVAFALIKLFDYVGVIIIAIALMAIYVTYFFSTGRGTLKTLGYNVLKGTVITLASIERGIKWLIGIDKKEKPKKAPKKKTLTSRKSEKQREKLYEDDFFAVDNGIESLEISELGIREERSKSSIEARPTLQSKVHAKSSQRPDDLATAVKRERTEEDGYFETVAFTDTDTANDAPDLFRDVRESSPEPKKARAFTPFEVEYDAMTEDKTETKVPTVSDSADDVFTKGFDPFKFADTEPAFDNPTGKNAPLFETVGEITEEDVERARRNALFEARKTMLKEMQKQEAEKVADRTKPETDPFDAVDQAFGGSPYRAPDRVETPEPTAPKAIEYNTVTPEPTAPKATEYNTVTREPTPQKSVEYHTAMSPEPKPLYEEEEASITLDKAERPRYTGEYTETGPSTVYERRFEPPKREEVSYFSTEEKKEETAPDSSTGLVFEFESDTAQNVPEEKATIELERTRLTYPAVEITEPDETIDTDQEEDDEIPEGIESYEEEEAPDEEIPPEEQNPAINGFRDMFSMFRSENKEEEDNEGEGEDVAPVSETIPEPLIIADEPTDDGETDEIPTEDEEEELDLPFERPTRITPPVKEISPEREAPKKDAPKKPDFSNYKFPSLDFLSLGKPQNDEEINEEIKQNTTTLIETLDSFNVTASIKGVDRGPRITRYEVVPAKGVKVQAITGLFDDIALNLAAEGIRMEAPIPGKSAIGFEIPNKNPTNVTLRELLECEEFINAKSKTFVCIGKDVAGSPVFGDIAKFPHALVAGATGMGKSVCINSIMISMLYKARPDEVKFIMIDPKKVEFRMYSGIPHLLIPVITEAKQAAGALMWAVEEMERRYSLIEQLNIRSIESYNERCAVDKSIGEPMPKIVIVIDELNDLMMQVRDPVEDLIMRIAQKARAAGIHLIIGTQRPDVKVVTGTIKANINTRISCKVTSVQDSRTILEMAGAEKLLNRGDMLFKPVDKPKPIRVQGCFVSDPEVEAIMDFLKAGCDGNIYNEEVFAEINRAAQKCGNKKNQGGDDDTGDDGGDFGYYSDQQFLDAVELAIRSGKVSTSLLQRKLSIGYGKAAKYIDAMEDIGIVSEQNGQKPRDVLLSLDEWHEKLTRVNFDE